MLAALGEGGMGAVYRARDTKLGRDVAIKVLRPEVAGSPERLARFEREAKLLASLNHPHIAQIYGVEEGQAGHAGLSGPFLVLELVEGDTLADVIARGPVPLVEALRIARQIAEALEAAHEQGIIHRDLKPLNIKVRPDGTVKVLDFGLAKALEPNSAPGPTPALSNSPTLTSPTAMTGVGVLLGTAAYMSPEQATGRPADRRSDIWAFGCVLYEMLTGQPAFTGTSVVEVLASTVRDEPAWSRLPEDLHPSVVRLLRRCLAKDPRQRLPHSAAIRLELDEATSPVSAAPRTSTRMPRFGWGLLPWALAASLAAGLVVVALRQPAPRQAAEPPVSRLVIPIGPLSTSENGKPLAISPDGRVVVYASGGQLYRRNIDDLVARPIVGTTGAATYPVFSPDSKSLVFQRGRSLAKVPLEGGIPAALRSDIAENSFTIGWGRSGIIFEHGVLESIDPDRPDAVVPIDATTPDGTRIRHPQQLDDGLLFTLSRSVNAAQSIGYQRRGAASTVLVSGSDAKLLASGHLVWARNSALFAAGFDPKRGILTTAPVEVLRGVAQSPRGLLATSFHAVSDTGTLVYVPGVSADDPKALVWRDRGGQDVQTGSPERTYSVPRISPDGSRIALATSEAGEDVWVWDTRRRALQRVTAGDAVDLYAIWTPDGNQLIYSSTLANRRRLMVTRADGSGEPRVLLDDADTVLPNEVTRDGKDLVFSGGQHGIRVVPLDGGAPRTVTGPPLARSAALSPDNRFIAYQSSETGVSHVYVRPYPDAPRAKWQISTSGGTRPVWAHSGRELFYVNDRNQMVAVPIGERGSELVMGEPKMLFDVSDALSAAYRNFDVSADDQTFIIPKGAPVLPSNQIVVVQNWFEELRRLVPLGAGSSNR